MCYSIRMDSTTHPVPCRKSYARNGIMCTHPECRVRAMEAEDGIKRVQGLSSGPLSVKGMTPDGYYPDEASLIVTTTTPSLPSLIAERIKSGLLTHEQMMNEFLDPRPLLPTEPEAPVPAKKAEPPARDELQAAMKRVDILDNEANCDCGITLLPNKTTTLINLLELVGAALAHRHECSFTQE